MEKSDLLHHYSQRFNEELEEIRTMVLAMGGMVEQQLETAVGALITGDVTGAEQVVADDYKVNALDVQIDERCTLILARRQPTASDLRLVLAVIKTTADLERIGDEAKRVARMAIRLGAADHARSLFLEVEHMGSLSRHLLNKALDAYARLDVEAALDVAKEDQRIDREYENVMRQAITYMMEDPRSIPFVLDIIWSARALERIGDRCRNISEYVIYLVKGKDVRHTSLEKIEEEIIRR
ncbi:MAG: phosphate signaling complex protein PhoU [Gammaproteobacteria bacterium]|jgi:phosphate transport system protein|nr:phosphate signaling complex protein PhoU [Gammaproteobacteria bacterium]